MATEPKLAVEIVAPQGITLQKNNVDYVVVRLEETDEQLGSELAIWPRHAPLLARISSFCLRYRREGKIHTMDIEEGVLQVQNDEVTIVVFIEDKSAGSETKLVGGE